MTAVLIDIDHLWPNSCGHSCILIDIFLLYYQFNSFNVYILPMNFSWPCVLNFRFIMFLSIYALADQITKIFNLCPFHD